MSMSTEDCLVQSGEVERRRSGKFELSMSIVYVEPEISYHSSNQDEAIKQKAGCDRQILETSDDATFIMIYPALWVLRGRRQQRVMATFTSSVAPSSSLGPPAGSVLIFGSAYQLVAPMRSEGGAPQHPRSGVDPNGNAPPGDHVGRRELRDYGEHDADEHLELVEFFDELEDDFPKPLQSEPHALAPSLMHRPPESSNSQTPDRYEQGSPDSSGSLHAEAGRWHPSSRVVAANRLQAEGPCGRRMSTTPTVGGAPC